MGPNLFGNCKQFGDSVASIRELHLSFQIPRGVIHLQILVVNTRTRQSEPRTNWPSRALQFWNKSSERDRSVCSLQFSSHRRSSATWTVQRVSWSAVWPKKKKRRWSKSKIYPILSHFIILLPSSGCKKEQNLSLSQLLIIERTRWGRQGDTGDS